MNNYSAYVNSCAVKRPEVSKQNKLIQVQIGQGEGETKWKGWSWKCTRFKIGIINKMISILKVRINSLSYYERLASTNCKIIALLLC